MKGLNDFLDEIIYIWNTYKSVIIALGSLIITASPKIIKKIFIKCDPCFITETIKVNNEKQILNLFDENILPKINVNKKKNKYAITQMILWNKGRIPLNIEDYKVFRKDTDPLEKTPTLTVGGSIIAVSSYIDSSYFFELTTSKKNDNTVEFRYKDEISYNEGFVLNILTRIDDGAPLSNPQLSMILNHKKVRELKKIHSWKYFSFFIFEIVLCIGAPINLLFQGEYLFAAFYLIPLFLAFLFARDVFEQSFNTIPKPLRQKVIKHKNKEK